MKASSVKGNGSPSYPAPSLSLSLRLHHVAPSFYHGSEIVALHLRHPKRHTKIITLSVSNPANPLPQSILQTRALVRTFANAIPASSDHHTANTEAERLVALHYPALLRIKQSGKPLVGLAC